MAILPFLSRLFQSTLPVWGATDALVLVDLAGWVSIHAPRVGSDSVKSCILIVRSGFQSTLPVWGAT